MRAQWEILAGTYVRLADQSAKIRQPKKIDDTGTYDGLELLALANPRQANPGQANPRQRAQRDRREAVFLFCLSLSAFGTKRTSPSALHMSAFDPKRTSQGSHTHVDVKRTKTDIEMRLIFIYSPVVFCLQSASPSGAIFA